MTSDAEIQKADEVAKMAYDAAVKSLAQQDTTLGNLRNRATWVLTAAGVLASLASAIGLLNTDVSKGAVAPPWFKLGLLASVTLIGLAAVSLVWPVSDWTFGPRSAGLIEDVGKDETDVRVKATKALGAAIDENNSRIRHRAFILIGAFLVLIIEIVFILLRETLASGRLL